MREFLHGGGQLPGVRRRGGAAEGDRGGRGGRGEFGAEQRSEHGVPPAAWASGYSWPADRAAELCEGIRLGGHSAVHRRRAERGEGFRHEAQPCGGLPGREGGGEHRIVGGVPDRGDLAVRGGREGRHVTSASSTAGHRVTPAGDRVWARRRRPRWAATRTAPGLRPTILATASLSRPASIRSRITSACRGGNARTASVTAAVARFSM